MVLSMPASAQSMNYPMVFAPIAVMAAATPIGSSITKGQYLVASSLAGQCVRTALVTYGYLLMSPAKGSRTAATS